MNKTSTTHPQVPALFDPSYPAFATAARMATHNEITARNASPDWNGGNEMIGYVPATQTPLFLTLANMAYYHAERDEQGEWLYALETRDMEKGN